MIPRTFPSTFAANGQQQMVVYSLPSITGLTAWIDYIPVKGVTTESATLENTYANGGYQAVDSLASLTGKQAWLDYIPVYEDASYTKPWSTDAGGYIPTSALAALLLDFTSGRLDPRITFSRTTNATLTNSAGLVANAPMNLLTFSEQFDNAAWVKGGVTITANATASPDGTTTADRYVESALNEVHSISSISVTAASGATYTLSVYAKNAGRFLRLILPAGTFGVAVSANFDLVNGIAYDTAGSGAVIQSVGNGWYRCSICVTATTGATGTISVSSAATSSGTGSYTGDGISGVYLWGAQLEIGSTATTYNPTTVKNLLGFTEHFDNAAWTKTNASISATKVDDIYGQPFAQKLVEDTATGVHRVSQQPFTTFTGGVYVLSVYAKKAERNWLQLRDVARALGAWFNLDDGTVGTVASGLTALPPESLGNGWYRCSIVRPSQDNSIVWAIAPANADGATSYTGDGTSGIYIFGAQLSDSASVDPYVYQPVAAPSSVAYYGPRFDYDPVTLAPKGLLVEEQRSNLLTYSEQFDNAAWTKVLSTSVTPNSAVSPDGTTNADLLTFTSQFGCIQQSATLTSGTQYTISFWAKVNSGSNTYSVYNNTSGVSLGTVTPTGAWVRYAFTFTAAATGVAVFNLIQDRNASGFGSVFIWGAQFEAGAFATSYIPTVASQVTRAADSASMIGNNFARWYTQGAGTVFADYATVYQSAAYKTVVQLTDGSNNYVQIRSFSVSGTTMGANNQAVTAGSLVASFETGSVASPFALKTALAYATNDFAGVSNGGAVLTDTLGAIPLGLNALSMIGGTFTNGSTTIKRIAYYNRRLSNTELQGITS